jgi:hypothetical protein
MDVEALIRQLQQLRPNGSTQRTYAEIEMMFPPGIEDDGIKSEIAELAEECRCDIRNQPNYENIVFAKRP